MIVCPASNIMPFWIIRTKGASRQIAEKKKIIKKKTWIHRKRYLRSPPQIDGGTPKVGTELADSHQESPTLRRPKVHPSYDMRRVFLGF
jgi:hypothetical protein